MFPTFALATLMGIWIDVFTLMIEWATYSNPRFSQRAKLILRATVAALVTLAVHSSGWPATGLALGILCHRLAWNVNLRNP